MNEKPRPPVRNDTSFCDCHRETKAKTTVSTISKAESSDCSNEKESFVTIGNKKVPILNWKRIDYKDDKHDNRRLLVHRAKNCECEVCYRELKKLPPVDPIREKIIARKHKLEEREIRKAKRLAKTQVKEGKQACIRNFFRY